MSSNDVAPQMYPTVLREMIRHENDVTNHRIMWLLISQGLIANAYVGLPAGARSISASLAGVGILITLSAYLMLYKSYHARGYVEFLGRAAKAGILTESLLPMTGWPGRRVKDWRKQVWACPWLWTFGDLLEPYLFLPTVLILAWFVVLCRHNLTIDGVWILPLSVLATAILFTLLTAGWVRLQKKEEVEVLPATPPSGP